MILALALGAVVMSGCAEKKQPAEKAQEAAVRVKEGVVEKPVEVKQEAPAAAAETVAKVEEKAIKKVVEKKVEAAVAVKKAATMVEEKIAASAVAVEKALEKPAAAVIDVKAGAAIFKSKCSPCHGALGNGTAMAPAFVGNDWIKSAAKGEIAGVIKNGREGSAKRYKKFAISMPSNKNMPDSDINLLVDYIKSIN